VVDLVLVRFFDIVIRSKYTRTQSLNASEIAPNFACFDP